MTAVKHFLFFISITLQLWPSFSKAAGYPALIPMQEEYIERDLETTPYFPHDERLKLELKPTNGFLISNHQHKAFSFLDRIFVISSDGKMYSLSSVRMFSFHHSSPVSGEPVIFAGNAKFMNGKIIRIDNNSGHYRPNEVHFFNALIYLKALHVLSENVDIYYTSEAIHNEPAKIGKYQDFITFFRTKNPELYKQHLCLKNYGSPYIHVNN